MIKPKCDKCGEELQAYGGLAFSPPETLSDESPSQQVDKIHICAKCWKIFLTWLKEPNQNINNLLKPRTLLAKWLDPLCWDGCKSLVFKKERDEARRQRDEMAAGFAASEKIIDAISITGHLSKSMLEGESPVGWVKRMISERDEAIERASIFESAATKALNERDEAKVLLSLIRERLCVLQSERNDSVPLDGLANIAIKRLQWRTEERDEAKECLREAMRAIEGISAMPDPIKPEVLNRWNKVAN